MPFPHTFYSYARDPPKTRSPHIRHIRENVGGARYIEIPERCPCQDDPRLAARKPLLDKGHEEQFWRNLHTFTGLRARDAAFEMDEKVRRDEEGDEKVRRDEDEDGNEDGNEDEKRKRGEAVLCCSGVEEEEGCGGAEEAGRKDGAE